VICQACFVIARGDICPRCREELRISPERLLHDRFRTISVFEHTGPAAKLMHGLKYRGNEALLRLIAPHLARLIAPRRVFVPVPRVWSRYLRYGIDPAQRLAQLLALQTGGHALDLLERPIHNRRRAGSSDRGGPPSFTGIAGPLESVVLVDDVLTTGTTLLAAAEAINPTNVEFFFTVTSARPLEALRKSGV
jgi:predicted amidophosphoribosyltransferase